MAGKVGHRHRALRRGRADTPEVQQQHEQASPDTAEPSLEDLHRKPARRSGRRDTRGGKHAVANGERRRGFLRLRPFAHSLAMRVAGWMRSPHLDTRNWTRGQLAWRTPG